MGRIRRPFRLAGRKPTRPELTRLLCWVYGSPVPQYAGSPYQETKLDPVEIVLHELAHMTQIPGLFPPELGNMAPTWDVMMDHLNKRVPKEVADEQEIRTIAIVLGAARSLRLPLSRYRLVASGARNSHLLHSDVKTFDARVAQAEADRAVRCDVQRVLDLLDEVWQKMISGSDPEPHPLLGP